MSACRSASCLASSELPATHETRQQPWYSERRESVDSRGGGALGLDCRTCGEAGVPPRGGCPTDAALAYCCCCCCCTAAAVLILGYSDEAEAATAGGGVAVPIDDEDRIRAIWAFTCCEIKLGTPRLGGCALT